MNSLRTRIDQRELTAVLDIVRSASSNAALQEFPTDDDLCKARLYYDLDIQGHDAFTLFTQLIKVVALDPALLPQKDNRFYFPPETYSILPPLDSYRRLKDKKSNYYPITVRELLDACKAKGSPNTIPDDLSPSDPKASIWRWNI